MERVLCSTDLISEKGFVARTNWFRPRYDIPRSLWKKTSQVCWYADKGTYYLVEVVLIWSFCYYLNCHTAKANNLLSSVLMANFDCQKGHQKPKWPIWKQPSQFSALIENMTRTKPPYYVEVLILHGKTIEGYEGWLDDGRDMLNTMMA